jgi:hypothetical protein
MLSHATFPVRSGFLPKGTPMGWFNFLRRSKPPPPASPFGSVRFDDDAVVYERPKGATERIRWGDLQAVLIETTDAGPVASDFYWMLLSKERKSGCVVPSEAEGCNALLSRLQQLPGFDNWLVIRAAASTETNRFLIWERDMVARVQAALDSPVELPTSITQDSLSLLKAVQYLSEFSAAPIGIDARDFKIRFHVDDVGQRQVMLSATPGMTLRNVLTKVVEQVDGAFVYGPERIIVTTRHS